VETTKDRTGVKGPLGNQVAGLLGRRIHSNLLDKVLRLHVVFNPGGGPIFIVGKVRKKIKIAPPITVPCSWANSRPGIQPVPRKRSSNHPRRAAIAVPWPGPYWAWTVPRTLTWIASKPRNRKKSCANKLYILLFISTRDKIQFIK
jgi:hypothetical protein